MEVCSASGEVRDMEESVSQLIDLALNEDIGSGDVTSEYFVPQERRSRAFLNAREEGVVAGTEVAAEVFRRVDPETKVKILLPDGARIFPGALICLLYTSPSPRDS